MIKHWLLTGDVHAQVLTRLRELKKQYPNYEPNETALIILGDSGFNFYLDYTSKRLKADTCATDYTIYCVRGNHEERPQNIEGMKVIYDEEVQGLVYVENKFPNIKYFVDGENYLINGHHCLVIGGAYSVDKYWRLQSGENSGWFPEEQLTKTEMRTIEIDTYNETFDFVFTHTCPYSWRPTDLFIRGIDQSMVDTTMEVWMDKLKETFNWGMWCFGHYHADRKERKNVYQFYHNIIDIEELWKEKEE